MTSLLSANVAHAAMGKSKEKRASRPEAPRNSAPPANSFIKLDKAAFDPTLASLFATSVRCPLQMPTKGCDC